MEMYAVCLCACAFPKQTKHSVLLPWITFIFRASIRFLSFCRLSFYGPALSFRSYYPPVSSAGGLVLTLLVVFPSCRVDLAKQPDWQKTPACFNSPWGQEQSVLVCTCGGTSISAGSRVCASDCVKSLMWCRVESSLHLLALRQQHLHS